MAFADPAAWTSTALSAFCPDAFFQKGKGQIYEDVCKLFERKMAFKLIDLCKTAVHLSHTSMRWSQ